MGPRSPAPAPPERARGEEIPDEEGFQADGDLGMPVEAGHGRHPAPAAPVVPMCPKSHRSEMASPIAMIRGPMNTYENQA